MNQVLKNIIEQLEEIQNGKLWIGTDYARILNDIDDELAFIQPNEHLHSVAEIISHLTLWRKETILKIKTETGSKTDECEENWLPNDKLRLIGWKKLKAAYDVSLTEIISLLNSKDDQFLNKLYYDTDFKDNYPYRFVIQGMLHHDIYHLGHLGIIIKILKSR